MEALVKTHPDRGLTYRSDWVEPTLGDGDVLVEVASAAICGTDVHLYDWDAAAANFPLRLPRVLGHEVAGVVRSVGSGVTGVAVGDRVALETHIPCGRCFACTTGNAHNCENVALFGIDRDGAFATLTTAPASVVFPLPPELTFEAACLLEPAGVAMHAIQRAEIQPGDIVAVAGCGPIGLMTCALAFAVGASRVIAFDVNEHRLKAGRSLGALGLDPRKAGFDDEAATVAQARGGVDVAIELSGASSVYNWLLDLVRREGTVVTVGHPGTPVAIDITQSINKRGLTLRGVFGRRMWSTWHALSELLSTGRFQLEPFITHRFALADYESGFSALRKDAVKVLLTPAS